MVAIPAPTKCFVRAGGFVTRPYKPVFKGRWFKDPPLLLIFNLLQSINFKKIAKQIQKPWKFNPIIVVTSRTRKNMKIISQCIFSFRVWKSQRMGLCYSSESPILWFVHYEHIIHSQILFSYFSLVLFVTIMLGLNFQNFWMLLLIWT